MLEFDVQVHRGETTMHFAGRLAPGLTGISGPSGAGKTTLLSCLAGLTKPVRGRITLRDRCLFDHWGRVNVPARKRNIGVVFQDSRLFPHLTVEQNLLFGCHRHLARTGLNLTDVVEPLEIGPLLHQPAHVLSGGEQQRVALGRALLHDPEWLFLDEPLSALDGRLRQRILPFLRRWAQERNLPMLVVSHQLGELLDLTPELLLVADGRCVGQGRIETLMRHDTACHLLVRQGLVNVLHLRVVRHELQQGITVTQLLDERGHMVLPEDPRGRAIKCPIRPELPAHSIVSIQLRSRDIALAMAPVEYISMQNQRPGRITDMHYVGEHVLCRVDVGVPIFADVTQQTALDLGLQAGKKVWCLFKAHGLDYSTQSTAGGPKYTTLPKAWSSTKVRGVSHTKHTGTQP